jgi:predicted DNA binding protein
MNVEYASFNILKATRVAIVRGSQDDNRFMIKSALNNDKSIIDYEISHLISNNRYSFYMITMLQDADSTVIGRLRAKGILMLNASIKDGKEIYEIIVSKDTEPLITNSLKNDSRVEIINFISSNLKGETLFKMVSRNVMDMLLTEKEQLLMKKARELGYFNVPRKRNLEEVAKELGVSKMNISLSLRNILKKVSNLIYAF